MHRAITNRLWTTGMVGLAAVAGACGGSAQRPDVAVDVPAYGWGGNPGAGGTFGPDVSTGGAGGVPADPGAGFDAGSGSGGGGSTGVDAARGEVLATGGSTRSAAGGVVGSGGASGPSTGGAVGSGGETGNQAWWKPKAGLSWQWQIGGGSVDPGLAVDVFDIDWEESANTVASLHQAGKKVICYVSVGSWEDWRPDAASFPAAVLGKAYPGWPGEKFVDIRAAALRTVMAKRLDVCRSKGFDAVEPDNMDVFGSDSGFPLTQADGVDYAKWLAAESHARGMAIVQKNASEITDKIQSFYDGALTEDCYDGDWCSDMQAYIDVNKPVFACEYNEGIFAAACTWGKQRKYSFILKDLDLTAPATFCP